MDMKELQSGRLDDSIGTQNFSVQVSLLNGRHSFGFGHETYLEATVIFSFSDSIISMCSDKIIWWSMSVCAKAMTSCAIDYSPISQFLQWSSGGLQLDG